MNEQRCSLQLAETPTGVTLICKTEVGDEVILDELSVPQVDKSQLLQAIKRLARTESTNVTDQAA